MIVWPTENAWEAVAESARRVQRSATESKSLDLHRPDFQPTKLIPFITIANGFPLAPVQQTFVTQARILDVEWNYQNVGPLFTYNPVGKVIFLVSAGASWVPFVGATGFCTSLATSRFVDQVATTYPLYLPLMSTIDGFDAKITGPSSDGDQFKYPWQQVGGVLPGIPPLTDTSVGYGGQPIYGKARVRDTDVMDPAITDIRYRVPVNTIVRLRWNYGVFVFDVHPEPHTILCTGS